MDDRRIKVLEIAKIMEISYGSVQTIIQDHLKMTKVCLQDGYLEIWQHMIGVSESQHHESS